MEALIAELAKKYKDDHKLEEDAAKEQITQKLTKTKSKSHGTTVRLLSFIINTIVIVIVTTIAPLK